MKGCIFANIKVLRYNGFTGAKHGKTLDQDARE